MEDYIGKICPYCKTEIKEGEEIKVCPECGIPHHLSCWEENHGCTTFGCKEQHYEEQHTNPTDVCANCGAPLGDGQAFCPKCGTPKNPEQKKVCSKCGAELQDDQMFCPKCGQKVDFAVDSEVSDAIQQYNAGVNKANATNKKRPTKLIIIAIAAIAVIALCAFIFPKIFVSVEDLCAQGNYEKAYAKASEEEKAEVLAENAVAVCSAYCVDNLKDSKSFDLREAWYDAEDNYVVLNVAANNSYGNTVLNYWLFYYSESSAKWSLWDVYTDLETEDYSKYDDSDEIADKFVHNMGIVYVKSTMTNDNELSKNSINNINKLFEDELLESVEFLDVSDSEEAIEAEEPAAAS